MNKWRKHLVAGSVILALGVPGLALAQMNSYGDQGNQNTGADTNGSSAPNSNGQMGQDSNSGNSMNSDNNMGSGNSMGSEASHKNMSRHEVMQIQQALNQSGDNLSVDGIIGPDTRSALREYQRSHGLQATGNPDPQTLQQLGINQ